ncbi:hypothetical protein DPV78_002370 [Talaromyces pinophilus]|nr:hypothetical protein DPV78_002370 [Talaromyces pinophilus]
MAKIILSVNAGSSSVKITFYKSQNPPSPIVDAQISGITSPPQTLKYSKSSGDKKEQLDENLDTPPKAFKYLLERCLSDTEISEIANVDDLACICHRVVHGGDYEDSIEIDDSTYHHLEKIEDLAPLHNFSALEIIRACRKELPNVRNIAHFDSAFHRSLPLHVRTYPIDQEIAKKNGLRKYGFHGISYSFILRSVAQFLGKPRYQTNLIVMHIGSGASICAIEDGKSIDTSMGLTPLAGLPGATRSGDIDPSLVFHYTSDASSLSPASTKEMHISTAEEILNKKSGWKGLTGTTDFAQIAVENPPTENHKLAFDIVVDRISGYLGNYYVKLQGKLDAVVFAGGIGEKSALLRKAVTQQCNCLGFDIDSEKNDRGVANDDPVTDISKSDKGSRVLICQTNEQFEMAYHTLEELKMV